MLPVDASSERKPWEPLVVGVVAPGGELTAPEALGAAAARLATGDAAARPAWTRAIGALAAVPETLAFAAPPGSHSAKPRLDALFEACFRGPVRGKLELFGRGAFEGWTVAGDQALPLAPAPGGSPESPPGAA